jgi:N-acetylglutamate synthase-like GNAT family acetyltransferase
VHYQARYCACGLYESWTLQGKALKSTQAITLRRATAADAEGIWQVRIRAIRSGCKNHYAADIIDAWVSNPMPASFQSYIEVEPFYVAELNSHIVGFAGLKRATAEFDALFVAPEIGRAGVGVRLLRHVENVARELLLTKLTLNASLNSVSFYKAEGYCEGSRGMHATTSGLQIACVHMEKNLAGHI